MRKIQLMFGSNSILTKEQMKMITGGEEQSGACYVTTACGYTNGYIPCISADYCKCQEIYDAACLQEDCCVDIDCGCHDGPLY